MNTQRKLARSFYARDTHVVAKDLLGKLLVRRWRGKEIIGRILEVESYIGEDDAACHARFGRTKRNAIMFGEAGHAYVYLIYGMYHMLNVVTEKKGFPAAVLIRRVWPAELSTTTSYGRLAERTEVSLAAASLLAGPGKLTRELVISRAQNGIDLVTSKQLLIVDDGFHITEGEVITSPRIGVEYAGEDALLPWRYELQSNAL